MTALARLIHPDTAPALRPVFVARSREHERLETLLHNLRQRRKEMAARLEALTQSTPGVSDVMRDQAGALHALGVEIREVRASLSSLRAHHLGNVRKALKGPTRDASQRALAALREAEAAIAEVNAMRAEVRKFGGDAPDVSVKALLYVSLPLERLARGEKGGTS